MTSSRLQFRAWVRIGMLAIALLACGWRPCCAGPYEFDSPYHDYEVAGSVGAMAIADVNSDGVSDLVFTNLAWTNAAPSIRAISVVLGPIRANPITQLNTFVLPPLLLPEALALADFNDDGKLDVATLGPYNGGVFLGIGNGRFQDSPAATLPTALRMAAADIDHDSHADIALLGYGGIVVFHGRGDGTFSTPETLSVAPSDGFDFAIGDLDGDGWPDFFVTGEIGPRHYGSSVCLMNNHDGTFRTVNLGPGIQLAVIADVTGDGLPDPVAFYDGYLTVWRNLGNGNFGAPSTTDYGLGDAYASGIVAADLNGDGHTDLVAAPPLLVLLGSGTGTFSPATYPTDGRSSPAVADFDGDGVPDVVVADADGFCIAPGHPDGTFGGGGLFSPLSSATSIATADLDGDGRLDAAVVTRPFGTDSLTILRGDGTGAFAVHEILGIGAGSLTGDPLRIADVDSDGRPDVLLTKGYDGYFYAPPFGNELLAFPNNGDSFGAFTSSTTSSFPQTLAVADLDHDGVLDAVVLAFPLSATPVLDLMKGLGNGGFTLVDSIPYNSFTPYGSTTAFALADVNEDGIPDILAPGATSSGFMLLVYLATSPWHYAAPVNLSVTGGVVGIATGDLNQDGHLDLVLTELVRGVNAPNYWVVGVYLGRGDGSFTQPLSYGRSLAEMGAITLADMNRDGIEDVIVSQGSSARVQPGIGDGSLGPPQLYGFTGTFSVADLDHDGYPDLIGSTGSGILALRSRIHDHTTPVRTPEFSTQALAGRVIVRVAFEAYAPIGGILERAPGISGPYVAISDTLRDLTTVTFVDSTVVAGTYYYELRAWDAAGIATTLGPLAVLVTAASEFAIASIAPNPAREGAEIAFSLGRSAPVRLAVYDVQGRQTAVLVNGVMTAGRHRVLWNARGPAGRASPGLYFVRYQTPAQTIHARLVVLP